MVQSDYAYYSSDADEGIGGSGGSTQGVAACRADVGAWHAREEDVIHCGSFIALTWFAQMRSTRMSLAARPDWPMLMGQTRCMYGSALMLVG